MAVYIKKACIQRRSIERRRRRRAFSRDPRREGECVVLANMYIKKQRRRWQGDDAYEKRLRMLDSCRSLSSPLIGVDVDETLAPSLLVPFQSSR